MKNINVAIKEIRDAQAISQASIASKLGITQSSVAQFETNRAKVSLETLLKIAPLINLNPDFIQDRTCNPFKQVDKDIPIKMYISNDRNGEPDFYMLKKIVEMNDQCNIVYCGDSRPEAIKGKRVKTFGIFGCIIYIYVQDSDNNVFLIRRKDRDALDVTQLDKELREIAVIKKRGLFTTVTTDIPLCDDVDSDYIRSQLSAEPNRKNIEFIDRLINGLREREVDTENRSDFEDISRYVHEMDADNLEFLLKRITRQITKIVKKEIKPPKK